MRVCVCVYFHRFLSEYGYGQAMNFLDFGSAGDLPMKIPKWISEVGSSNGVATELTQEDIDNKVHRVTGVVTECAVSFSCFLLISFHF